MTWHHTSPGHQQPWLWLCKINRSMYGFQLQGPSLFGNCGKQIYTFMIAKMNTACQGLTHKYLELYGCILSTMATDALVLKHQAISINSASLKIYYMEPVPHKKKVHVHVQYCKIKLDIEKNELHPGSCLTISWTKSWHFGLIKFLICYCSLVYFRRYIWRAYLLVCQGEKLLQDNKPLRE